MLVSLGKESANLHCVLFDLSFVEILVKVSVSKCYFCGVDKPFKKKKFSSQVNNHCKVSAGVTGFVAALLKIS